VQVQGKAVAGGERRKEEGGVRHTVDFIEGVVMAHAASSDLGQVSRLGREEDGAAATADADIVPSAGLPGATHMYESHPLPSVSTTAKRCVGVTTAVRLSHIADTLVRPTSGFGLAGATHSRGGVAH
jgi:hypothetical protein